MALRGRLAEARNRALATEIEERKRVEAQLLHTAFHDDLTGLRNRAFLMDRLRSVLEQARSRPPFRFALLFVDLDRFKLVNDSLGHRTGDELLRVVAKRLAGCVRPQDVLARVGGDEFAILVDDADLAMAEGVAERIVEALRLPVQLGCYDLHSPCSIGLVVAPGRYELAEDLLRDADIAMYQAKKTGGRGYARCSPSRCMPGRWRPWSCRPSCRVRCGPASSGCTSSRCSAWRRGASLASRRWCAGSIPGAACCRPRRFIPVAEEVGLIGEIGRWVLRRGLRADADWTLAHPGRGLRLSVNVSGIELMDAMFVERLRPDAGRIPESRPARWSSRSPRAFC